MANKIAFSPYSSVTNKYINILVETIKSKGIEVVSMRSFLFNYKNFFSTKAIHLNWFEDLIGENSFNRVFDFFRKVLLLLLFKVSNKRIVWTMHNRESHKKGLNLLRNVLRYFILSFSSKIVIHCNESLKILNTKNKKLRSKVEYIPHPNYINAYGPCALNRDSTKNEGQVLKLLFLGAVKPYKNIELLVELAKKHESSVEIMIAGKPSSSEYKERLIEMSYGVRNLKLKLEFISDSFIPEIIESCDLMIIPLDLKSSLNSGSVMLSFSYCRSVICPSIGTVKDIHRKEYMFIYDYEDEKDHFEKMNEKVYEAILLKQKDSAAFKTFGEEMYAHVAQHNNIETIGSKLQEVYN